LHEKNLNISKKNILSKQNEILNEKFMKRILKTADILSFRKESFNNKPSCVVEFEDMVNEKNVRFVYHMILNNNKLNFVVFMYFKGDSNNNAFDKQRPLIKLITNNIKLK
jgi:hypothetical protein